MGTQLRKINLDNVKIASPCTENWNQMSGDERVRHCQKCRLNVYNISEMSRLEAEQLIASRIQDKQVCVRVFRRPDGTILTKDCPVGARRARVLWLKVQSLRIAAVTFFIGAISLSRYLVMGEVDIQPETGGIRVELEAFTGKVRVDDIETTNDAE